MKTTQRWCISIIALLIGYGAWLIVTDAPAYQFLIRLYVDKPFLKHTLHEWGILAPIIFIVLQAVQVVIAPIPGQLMGFLGGYLFGQCAGLLYSTIGLTLGSIAAFAAGRWLGARYVQQFVSRDIWEKLGFIVQAEGTILCFVIFLIPGLPKDMACYLFGLSPMPFWVFALIATLARIPDTWVVSAQGAHAASGDYAQVIWLTAIVMAVALPLYRFRHWLIEGLRASKETRMGTTIEQSNRHHIGSVADEVVRHSFVVDLSTLPRSSASAPARSGTTWPARRALDRAPCEGKLYPVNSSSVRCF